MTKHEQSLLRNIRGVALCGGLILACSLGACAPVDDGTAETYDYLYYRSTALWPQREVQVCWETAGNATEKAWVREALVGQRSWASAGNINFVGWGDCGTSNTGIHLRSGSSMSTSILGYSSTAPTVITLDFGASPQTSYTRCINNSLNRERCIRAVALHEFGHAIGYAHEQNRGSPPASCTVSGPQGSNGNATYGSWDVESITAYCNFSTELSTLDRRGTERVYGPPLRDAPRLRDYNGDGRSDILCVDVVDGSTYTDFASTAGQFAATDWSAGNSWCRTNGARHFVGDVNGDGRDDLVCHDVATGNRLVDYADASGRLAGTDSTVANGWCNTDRREVH